MAAAGLVVEACSPRRGAIPTTRPETIVPPHFSWNYTTFLNIVFLLVLAVLYWL